MRYFAYGSNMLTERLCARVPSAKLLCRARLSGHELRWHKQGRDSSGKCDAFHTGRADAVVWGVLFSIRADEKSHLDAAESAGIGYREKRVVVESRGDLIEAFTYRAEPTHIDPALQPYKWYKAFVLAGASASALPGGYVAALEAQQAQVDPSDARANQAWRLLRFARRA